MPLDPNISLSYQPPQIQNPLSTLAQVQQLKSGQMEMQQQQRSLEAQTALDQIMQGAFKTNPDGTMGFDHDAIANGMIQRGYGHMVPALQQSWTAADEARAKLNETNQQILKLQREGQLQAQKNLAFLAQGIADANYDKDAALAAVAASPVDAQTKNQFAQRILADPRPEAIRAFVDPIRGQSPDVQELLDKRKTAAAAEQTAASRAKTAQTGADKFELEKPEFEAKATYAHAGQASPALTSAAEQGGDAYAASVAQQPKDVQSLLKGLGPNPSAKAVFRALLPQDKQMEFDRQAAEEQNRQAQLGISRGQLGVAQSRLGLAQQEFQQKFGNPLEGATDADMLRYESILRGDSPMPSPRSTAGIKTANAVMALAAQRGDNYTDARYKTKQNFKTGGDSNNLVTLTTGLDHADLALKHSGDLGNSFSLLTGHTLSPEASRYTQDVQQLTGEVGKLVKGGMVTEGEHQALAKNLLSARQDIRDAALNETMQLLGGKVEGIQQKYRVGAGQDIPLDIYDKPTQERMRRFGIGGQTPSTGTQAPPTAVPTAAPKTATRAQLQKYAQLNGITLDQATKQAQAENITITP